MNFEENQTVFLESMNMNDPDIRWRQRFTHFKKALASLEDGIKYISHNYSDTGEIQTLHPAEVTDNNVKQGLIQSFEFTHELAWQVLKDYANFQGNADVKGARDATREGMVMKLLTNNGHLWMEMIRSRNLSSHTYNVNTADDIFEKIYTLYYPAFLEFRNCMSELTNENDK